MPKIDQAEADRLSRTIQRELQRAAQARANRPPRKPKRKPRRHQKPEPTRTVPNGFCVDCGIEVSRKDVLRCRKHANLRVNRTKVGTFDHELSLAATRRRTEKWRAYREEADRLREQLAALQAQQAQQGEPVPAGD